MDGASFFKTLALQSKSSALSPGTIRFSGGDETNSFPVSGSEVTIISSEGDHEMGSSKLKIKNIVNFSWEHKYSHGEVVAVHVSGNYIAYAITTPKNTGIVRVVNRVTEERLLVKGMRGPVKDLGFAHHAAEVIVGCVDSLGNLFVHRVTEQSNGLVSERVLEVMREGGKAEEEHRLIWCPYVPMAGEDEDEEEPDTSPARMLVLTHGSKAEVWSLDLTVEAHGSGPLAPEDVSQGLIQIELGEGVIVDAALSTDGTAVATANQNGEVKFYQVYMLEEGPPRCLHGWNPHNNAPVSSLYFLDNLADGDEQYWKFAVTGCNLNSELKIWSCETWTCLQTIKIARPEGETSPVRLKSALDPTARYLLLSDIDKWLVYVLSIDPGCDGGARVISCSEFATPAPFISFCCNSAGTRLVKQTTEGVQVEGQEGDEVSSGKERTVVRLYLVQPKSLQECSIIYEDSATVGAALKLDHDISFQEPSLEQQELGTSMLATSLDDSAPVSQSTPRIPSPTSAMPLDLAPLAGLQPLSDLGNPITLPSAPISLPAPLPAPLILAGPPLRPTDQLAEAASKISLLSPDQFKPAPKLKPDLVVDRMQQDDDEDESGGESEGSVPPNLERVDRVPTSGVSESGNSSPSREVAHILSVEEPIFEQGGQGSQQSESPDRTFQEEESLSPSPAPLAHFPTPPALSRPPPIAELGHRPHPTKVDDTTAGLVDLVRSLQAQIVEERERQADAMARLEIKLEAAMSREEQGELAGPRMEALFHKMASRADAGRKEQTEALLTSFSSTLVTRLDQVVTGELKRSLPGIVNRALEGVKATADREIASKFRGLDGQVEAGVREAVAKVVNSPQTRDAISRSVAGALTASLQNQVTESYSFEFSKQSRGMEQAMQVALRKMGEQFTHGTREYEDVLQKRMKAAETQRREELTPLITGLAGQMQEMKAEVGNLARGLANVSRQQEASKAGITAEEVRQIVRGEVVGALRDSSPRQHSTPKPDFKMATMRQNIQAHIQAGRIEAAFQAALSASDLQMVVFTCELLNTTQVFNSATCPLSQSVLLSLIQQLSVDLGDKTEVKHAYLHEALVNLDPNNPTTRAHIKTVLTGLDASLKQYIMANPNSKMTRNMKLLVMACGNQMQQ